MSNQNVKKIKPKASQMQLRVLKKRGSQAPAGTHVLNLRLPKRIEIAKTSRSQSFEFNYAKFWIRFCGVLELATRSFD